MADITFADISEFQTDLDAPAYIAGGHKAIIVRAHNGYRADKYWPGRRDYVRKHPFVCVGYYQYLVASRTAEDQAHAFIACVGGLKPNEFVVVDSEEGAGSQTSRVNAWCSIVDKQYGFPATVYASSSWFADRLGGIKNWMNRPRWVAGYPSSYSPNPAAQPAGCTFWQYSDRERFPGLAGGVDGNVYRGSAVELLADVRPGGKPTPAPSPPLSAKQQSQTTVVKHNGVLEVFVETDTGEVFHRWQSNENGNFTTPWQSMGTPGK